MLVTGATGQVGRRLVAALLADGQRVAILTRHPEAARALWPDAPVEIRAGDLADPASLAGVCADCATLFHLASHAPGPAEPDLYAAPGHWAVTADGTDRLMTQAARSDLRQVVYISSVKAMGDRAGAGGQAADETLPPAPDSLYGRAKLAAERRVLALGQETGIRTCVLRLPMVYGLDGAGNLPRLVAAVKARRFPPWPRRVNRRSAVHVEDAIAAARLAARHPASAGETFCVTDGRAYSTRWIYERILEALGRPIPRWGVPLGALKAAAAAGTLTSRLTGRRVPLTLDTLDKLAGNACFSSAKLESRLGFRPRHDLEAEIRRLVGGVDA